MLSRVRIVIICLLVFVLSACSQNKQIKIDLEDFSERLSSFTELPIESFSKDSVLQSPAKPELSHAIPELNIALREFYAIDDCPLSQFIAERNTALGKTQLPSTRFVYEHRLLATLESCLDQLSDQHKMHLPLQQWIAQKEANLPLVWSNMMTQSDESYLAFTTSGGYISGNSEDGLQPSKLALQFLVEALEQKTLDSEQLELHLKELKNARLPAKMWRTQELLSQSLPPASNLLKQYIQNSQNTCNNAKKEELKIMRNIFSMFFADKIQPLASQLNHYQYQLKPSFEKLVSHKSIPAAWANYIQIHYMDSAERYKQSMQQHIELWQQVFKLCK